MIRIAFCVLALFVSTNLAVAQSGPDLVSREPIQGATAVIGGVAQSGDHDPVPRGTGEKKPEKRSMSTNHTSSGFTLDKLQGLPRTRTPVPTYQYYYYQPYPVYYGGYSYGSAYSYPHPYGLGGYVPQGVGGRGLWGGWWGW